MATAGKSAAKPRGAAQSARPKTAVHPASASKREAADGFTAAFEALRALLARHAASFVVAADTPKNYTLVSRRNDAKGKPVYFASVLLGKRYAAYHLMPLYCDPALAQRVPPELRARMQGKTCFNFRQPDPAAFAQLDALTAEALASMRRQGTA